MPVIIVTSKTKEAFDKKVNVMKALEGRNKKQNDLIEHLLALDTKYNI